MNIAAFVFALGGAGLNLFQPVITMPISGLGLGASMFDILLFFMNMILASGLKNIDIFTLLIFVLLISIPIQAVKNGTYAMQRRNDKNAVKGLVTCAVVYVIIAFIMFIIPHLATSSAEDRFLMSYGLNLFIPFTTPLIWAGCYAVAAFCASIDGKSEHAKKISGTSSKTYELIVGVETDALIKRGNIFLEDSNFEQADRYFEQAINQSPENLSAYLGKLMTELKVRHLEELSNVDVPLNEQKLFQRALSFANDEEKSQLEHYLELNAKNLEAKKQAEIEQTYIKALEMKEKISSLSDAQNLISILQSITPYKDSEVVIKELEQIKQNYENAYKNSKKGVIFVIAVIIVAIAFMVGYNKYLTAQRAAREHNEQQKREQARVEAEKNEEKSRIEALKLELQGQN